MMPIQIRPATSQHCHFTPVKQKQQKPHKINSSELYMQDVLMQCQAKTLCSATVPEDVTHMSIKVRDTD